MDKSMVRMPTVKVKPTATEKEIAVKEECISILPQISLFTRRDDKGRLLRCVKGIVKLSEKHGEIVTIMGKQSPTVLGYRRINQVVGVTLVRPPHCFIGGDTKPNPYIERDSKTGMIKNVTVRKIGITYSIIGNPMVADKTVSFTPYIYFLQNLVAKVKSFPTCGCLGTIDNKPTVFLYKDNKVDVSEKPVVFRSLEEDIGLWIDLSHPEIQEVISNYLQQQKFAERIADSCAERNCLKALIPISQMEFDPKTGTAEIEVFGWRDERTYKEILLVAEKVSENGVTEIINPTEEDMQVINYELQSEEGMEGDLLSNLGDFGNEITSKE